MKKALAALLLSGLCALNIFAQAGTSTIYGTVHDASGSAVPGAVVSIANDDKGVHRDLETSEAGIFNAPALIPASGYSITVTKAGFAKYEVKDIILSVGQTFALPVELKVASAATTVDVTSAAPLVDSEKSGVAQTVDQTQIENLPSNGRRVDNFVLGTSPAVTNDGEFGLLSFRGVAMGNSFLTEGNDTTNSFYNENAGRTRIGSQISADAVQEFQVLSDGFSAEFGRAMGGVVNTVVRSGSNDMHGTGYWYWRNHMLEALDRYANGVYLPEHRQTIGESLGGALIKDKMFFFENFDYTGRNFPGLNRIINNNFAPAGVMVPSTCGAPATPVQCAAAIAFIQKQMDVSVPRTYNQEIGLAKLDWRQSDKDTYSFSLNLMRWVSPNGIQTQGVLTSGNLLGNNANSTVQDKFGKASWTRVVNANSVNEFRFGWFKDRLSDPGASQLFPSTGPLYITVNSATVGAGQAYPRTLPSENRWQLIDNYSIVKGAHSIKFGFDFSTTEDYIDQLFNRYGGYSYSNISNYAADFSGNTAGARNYSTFTQQFGNPIQDLRTTDIGLYAQDTWKMTRRLTFNYGIRYERTWLPQPTLVNANWPQTGSIPENNKDFAPRASLSFTVNDKTVLRAGYGIFYARLHGNMLDTLFLGNSQYQPTISVTPSQAGAPIFPNIFANSTGLPSGTLSLQFAAPDFHSPYTQQGTLALERQIGKSSSFTANYIWTRGIGLYVQRNLNLGTPLATPVTYTIQDTTGTNVGFYTTPVYVQQNKVDTRYSNILQIENGGQSWYNALALQFNKRMSRGLQVQVAYTWSHAIDDGNEQGASWNISNTFNNATVPGNWAFDKGSSTTDQRHRATINWVWMPTLTKNNSFFAKNFVNGWGLSSITTLASAHPVTGTVASVSTTLGAIVPGFTLGGNTLNGSGGWNRAPFLPVGTLDIDQTYNVDARLWHNFAFGEKLKMMLAFEGFNVFNTIHNTGINSQAYTITGTVLKASPTLGLGTASQGFPDGTNARRAQAVLRFTF